MSEAGAGLSPSCDRSFNWPVLEALNVSEALWRQAKADLIVRCPGQPPDTVVWEHSSRVGRLVEFVAALPEAASQGVDLAALTAAGLYHDAGWVLQVHMGAVSARDILLRPTSDIQREIAADWLEQQAAGILSPGSIGRAVKMIRQLGDRRTDLLECRILADADNLDNIGPQAIGLMIRKMLAEGRTLADLVAAWDRQEEYQYWQARIKECFHFKAIRGIAQRRYQAMRECMNALRTTVRLEDLVISPSPTADASAVSPSTGANGGNGKPLQRLPQSPSC